MVEALPYRIPATLCVCVKCQLNHTLSVNFRQALWSQNLSPRCRTKTSEGTGGRSWYRCPTKGVRWSANESNQKRPHHSHALYSLHLPRRQHRFENDLIVLENSKAKSYDRVLRPQNFPTFQLNLDPGHAVPYDLNGRIQHDSETIRIIRMVTEWVSLPPDEVLEPTLIYAEMIFLREPARRCFECEVVRLEGTSHDLRGGIPGGLTQDEAIQDVCSGVCAYSKSKV